MKNTNIKLIVICLISCILTSCISNKGISNFQHLGNKGNIDIPNEQDSTLINEQDILQIRIDNLEEQTGLLINSYNTNGTYSIDNSGFIRFPLIGQIKAAGLTKVELGLKIERAFIEKNIAVNPLVSIKITNFKVTILGEVNKPGVFLIPEEKVTIPELLGLAGDLTPYAKRNNILLIRELNGNRTYQRFSLNDSAVFTQQIYYLRNRDILYVEPNSAKAFSSSQSRALLGFATGLITLVILVTGFSK